MAGKTQKYLVIITLILCSFLPYKFFVGYSSNISGFNAESDHRKSFYEFDNDSEKLQSPSILGEWLRAPEMSPPPSKMPRSDSSSPLLILVWKYGPFLERRHIRGSSPFRDCSVKDCKLSYNDEDIIKADAVLFHLHMTKSVDELPKKKGKIGQIWIFMTDESPLNTFLYRGNSKNRLSDYNDLFDWSMTYKSDSDIPVAYGRTIRRSEKTISESNIWTNEKKSKLVAIMGSNCWSKNSRWKYAKKLKLLLGDKLDIYGRCLDGNKTACPGHYYRDCPLLDDYKFYLAFENSNCREYITEKVYWHGYEKKSIPIIMGSPKEYCVKLLPPNSFIHVDDYSTPNELADYINYLDNNDTAYYKYHEWRLSYKVINEHGYFGSISKHYCRICEALSYNYFPPNHNYRFIENYWNATRDCFL